MVCCSDGSEDDVTGCYKNVQVTFTKNTVNQSRSTTVCTTVPVWMSFLFGIFMYTNNFTTYYYTCGGGVAVTSLGVSTRLLYIGPG